MLKYVELLVGAAMLLWGHAILIEPTGDFTVGTFVYVGGVIFTLDAVVQFVLEYGRAKR